MTRMPLAAYVNTRECTRPSSNPSAAKRNSVYGLRMSCQIRALSKSNLAANSNEIPRLRMLVAFLRASNSMFIAHIVVTFYHLGDLFVTTFQSIKSSSNLECEVGQIVNIKACPLQSRLIKPAASPPVSAPPQPAPVSPSACACAAIGAVGTASTWSSASLRR